MSEEDVEKIKKSLGAAIRKGRTSLGISQEELAERSNLHRTYIGDIERGRRNVGLLNIVSIAHALETTVSDLLKDIE